MRRYLNEGEVEEGNVTVERLEEKPLDHEVVLVLLLPGGSVSVVP